MRSAKHAQAAHTVVDKKDLAIVAQLALDRLAHEHVIIFGQHRVDGLPLLGRRVDRAHVAHAAQAHVQRAGNGRGAERQHVDVGAQLLEPLLLRHAKALLFVDDQHAQILEIPRFRLSRPWVPTTRSTVPSASPCMIFVCWAWRAEAAEHLDLDGERSSNAG